MDFEPQKFFIGVIDLFSVLLPGALLTFLLMDSAGPFFLGASFNRLAGTAGWLAFLFSSYLLGHFIFLIGAAFLDDRVYRPIRDATTTKEIRRLAKGGTLSGPIARFIAKNTIKKATDDALDRAIKIKKHYVDPVSPDDAINTFQWCKARLMLEPFSEAMALVERHEADSKFFRSFTVVIVVLMFLSLVVGKVLVALVSIVFLGFALWRYIDQRLKSVDAAYWYVISLEAKTQEGYREPAPVARSLTHAGGVVYRRDPMRRYPKYLLVQAKKNADWVLPRGNIEPRESEKETAVREVLEETGTWARIADELDTVQFTVKEETGVAKFYLMEALRSGKSSEHRSLDWLSLEAALQKATYDETRKLLRQADALLSTPDRSRS
jgi:8-oxo-dGTP pyrophosphatase MutT (NUDIX family)